jgi:hypothetical protein
MPPDPLPPVLEWLRRIVTEVLSLSLRRALVAFITGLHALPFGGLQNKITVELREGPTESGKLPIAHTCMSQLVISRTYDDLTHLMTQLITALEHTVLSTTISHGEGFQLECFAIRPFSFCIHLSLTLTPLRSNSIFIIYSSFRSITYIVRRVRPSSSRISSECRCAVRWHWPGTGST